MRGYRNVRRTGTRASLIAVIAVAAIAIPAPPSGAFDREPPLGISLGESGGQCPEIPDSTDTVFVETWIRTVFPIEFPPEPNESNPLLPSPVQGGRLVQIFIESSCPTPWLLVLSISNPDSEAGFPFPGFCCESTFILVPSGTVSVTITEEVLRAAGLTGFLAGGGISTPSQFPPDFILDPATGTLTPA
jgi:hypothetical protein